MNWWNAFTRTWYLIGEHAVVDLRATNTVTCRLCGQHYDAYGTGYDIVQGHDICAWIKKDGATWVIHCGYGSRYDLSEFWFLRDFPTEEVDGVCDYCITRMLHDGVIMDSGKELSI